MKENIVEKVRQFTEEEFNKPEACFKEAFGDHFLIVVTYSKELAKKLGADMEIVEIAGWLHDLGSIRGSPEKHHIVSAEIAEELLSSLDYDRDKIDQVKHCILSHRGSQNIPRESVEAQILADADAMSHFDDIDGLLKRLFKGNKEGVIKKLKRSYDKLSPASKELIKPKYEAAMLFLGDKK